MKIKIIVITMLLFIGHSISAQVLNVRNANISPAPLRSVAQEGKGVFRFNVAESSNKPVPVGGNPAIISVTISKLGLQDGLNSVTGYEQYFNIDSTVANDNIVILFQLKETFPSLEDIDILMQVKSTEDSPYYFDTNGGNVNISPGNGNAIGDEYTADFTYTCTGSSSDYDPNDENEVDCYELLPVTYSLFKAKSKGNDGILNWVTSSEINNDRFEVLRSYDGINFSYIGELAANGTVNEEQNYEYVDIDAGGLTRTLRKKVYYRLNQIDFDGTSDLSGIRVITFDEDPTGEMNVYPNPTRSYTIVDLGAECEDCTLKVYNTVGQEVENHSYQGAMSIDLRSITPGSYMINIISEKGEVKGAHRLMKAN